MQFTRKITHKFSIHLTFVVSRQKCWVQSCFMFLFNHCLSCLPLPVLFWYSPFVFHSRSLHSLSLCVSPALISVSLIVSICANYLLFKFLSLPLSCVSSSCPVSMPVVCLPAISYLVSSLIHSTEIPCKFCSSLRERFSLCLFGAFLSPC